MAFASDTFTGTEDTELSAYSASWTLMTGVTSEAQIANGRVRNSANSLSSYRHTATPASADYDVDASLYVANTTTNRRAGITGRAYSSANSYYLARLVTGTGWQLAKVVSGTFTQLGSSVAQSVAADTSYAVKLHMSGTTIELYKLGEGTAAVSVTDSAHSAAGFSGIYFNSGIAADTEAVHIDDWSATDAGGGAPTILPSSIASTEAFGTAAFARTSLQTIIAAGIASAEAFGAASFSRASTQTVLPEGVASAEVFGSTTFAGAGAGQILPQGIPSSEAFGTATVVWRTVFSVSGIPAEEAFGTALFVNIATLAPAGIPSTDAFGTATVSGTNGMTIFPAGMPSAEAFGAAAVEWRKTVSLSGIASAEAFGTSVFSQPGTRTLTEQDLIDIANKVWSDPRALTIARFLGLH